MTLPRLYPILDTQSTDDWSGVARAMLDGGARILQLRHKGEWTRDAFVRARRVADECGFAGATFVVNDRADIARMLGAWLHVGQEDLTPLDCRAVMGDSGVIGLSTHNAEQMRAAVSEPVDYVAIGPVFATGSKINPDPIIGVDGLRAIRALTALPLVAIGGISRANARLVFEAGADSVAVIADLLPQERSLTNIRERMEEWQRIVA